MQINDYIIRNYDKKTYSEMAKYTRISVSGIYNRVRKLVALGTLERKTKNWIKEEDELLLENYKTVDREILANILDTTPANISDRYSKLTSGRLGDTKIRTKKQIIQDEQEALKIDKLYTEILSRIEPIKGLKISNVQLSKGKTYNLKTYEKNKSKEFTGILIQDCEKHLVFRNKSGRCESFLKVDLLLNYEYKEV